MYYIIKSNNFWILSDNFEFVHSILVLNFCKYNSTFLIFFYKFMTKTDLKYLYFCL